MAGSSETDPVPERKQPNSSSPPSQTPKSWDEEENPFVAFRRYADEQISSMLQSVMGLPSAVSQPATDHWMIFADDGNYKDHTRQRRAGEGDGTRRDSNFGDHSSTNEHSDSSYDRSSSSRWPRWSRWSGYDDDFDRWRLHTSHRHHNRPFDFFGIDSFFDIPWFDDRFPFSFGLFNPYSPFLSDALGEAEAGAWPVPYLLFSPYSPLHLERQSRLRANRDKGILSSLCSSLNLTSEEGDPKEPRWRDAFEDLLRLENGRPMLERGAESAGMKETGSNWLRGLVERGSLGDRWKYVPSPNERVPSRSLTYENSTHRESEDVKSDLQSSDSSERTHGDSESTDSTSELDLYDRFLRDIEVREREHFKEVSDSPLLRLLFEERQRYRDGIEERRRRWRHTSSEEGEQDNESWLDLVSGGNKHSVPETRTDSSPEVTSSVDQNAAEPTASQSPVVMSTITSTERVTLPDGSVQTKTVKTKRYADGRQESKESVEVLNPSKSKPTQQASENEIAQDNDQNGKGGWFWKK